MPVHVYAQYPEVFQSKPSSDLLAKFHQNYSVVQDPEVLLKEEPNQNHNKESSAEKKIVYIKYW